MPAPIIAYIRVSTDTHGKSGLGLSAQRDAIARFAASEFLEVVAEFVEVKRVPFIVAAATLKAWRPLGVRPVVGSRMSSSA
jgi:hypothetical protein